jgi:hypothetical protein
MEADPMSFGIGNPGHPAHSCFYRLNQDFHPAPPAFLDGARNVFDRKGDTGLAPPIPFVPVGRGRAVEAEGDGFGGEFGPEAIPFGAAFQAKERTVEISRPLQVGGVVHHEIDGPDRNRRTPAGRTGRLAHGSAVTIQGKGTIGRNRPVIQGRRKVST